ncbi:MAG: LEA type 2 family protein [Deltaproteobacteria bacterium]|nr:LEA type 2 family protein [Deltaproteobacteria bacterium]
MFAIKAHPPNQRSNTTTPGRNRVEYRPSNSWLLMMLACCFLMQACATPMGVQFDKPTLNLVSVTPLAAEGFTQRFRLGFVMRNPNDSALVTKGMVYDVYFEDHKLLGGVSNDIPTIEGYTEGSFDVIASTNMMGSLRLIGDLMQQPRNEFAYRLEARLDLSSPINRKIGINETGEFSLSPATQ